MERVRNTLQTDTAANVDSFVILALAFILQQNLVEERAALLVLEADTGKKIRTGIENIFFSVCVTEMFNRPQ